VTESLRAETTFCHTVARLHRRRAVTWLLREVRARAQTGSKSAARLRDRETRTVHGQPLRGAERSRSSHCRPPRDAGSQCRPPKGAGRGRSSYSQPPRDVARIGARRNRRGQRVGFDRCSLPHRTACGAPHAPLVSKIAAPSGMVASPRLLFWNLRPFSTEVTRTFTCSWAA
jgi:hypothetical protein